VSARDELAADAAPQSPTAAVDPARRRRCLWALGLVAVGVVIVDHVVKAWVGGHAIGETFGSFVGGLITFVHVQNSGAAFSIGAGYTWIFTIVAVVVAVAILRASRRLGSVWWAVAFGGLLGGLLGNLIDRLTRPPGFGVGHVIDFIQVSHFGGIFNVADMFITCSAALMVVLALAGVEIDGSRRTS
jgi:signal peptidase II